MLTDSTARLVMKRHKVRQTTVPQFVPFVCEKRALLLDARMRSEAGLSLSGSAFGFKTFLFFFLAAAFPAVSAMLLCCCATVLQSPHFLFAAITRTRRCRRTNPWRYAQYLIDTSSHCRVCRERQSRLRRLDGSHHLTRPQCQRTQNSILI